MLLPLVLGFIALHILLTLLRLQVMALCGQAVDMFINGFVLHAFVRECMMRVACKPQSLCAGLRMAMTACRDLNSAFVLVAVRGAVEMHHPT